MKQKLVEIIEPSTKIFETYNYFEKIIKRVLPKSNVKLTGSFSVPMCGKKEIDVIVEVEDISSAQDVLSKEGFAKGPIVNNEAFSRSKEKEVVCELHILNYGAKKITNVYDKVTNILKKDKELREKFENLKRSLNGKSEEEYKEEKSVFLNKYIFNK